MADYNFVETTGVILVDTSTTRQSVVDEYRGIFGDDFETDSETPGGLLVDAETTSRQSVARNNAQVANQINPDQAGGVFADALLALTGDSRDPATRSTVTATLAGVSGTIIPQGSIATTQGGDQFRTTAEFTIGTGGTVDATFESVETGPISAAAGTLTSVTSSVLGWETVTNAAAAVLGVEEQGDQAALAAWREKRGRQGRSISVAVSSNVRAVSGVKSLAFRENTSSSTQVIDGVSLAPKSVWVAVDGGSDEDIAQALHRSKTAGAAWNGAVSQSIVDSSSGQAVAINFDRPTEIDISARVTVTRIGSAIDPTAEVRQAVLDYANGLFPGESGFIVGADVSPYEIASAASVLVPGLFVSRVEVATGTSSPSFSTDTIELNINQIARIASGNIQVLIA